MSTPSDNHKRHSNVTSYDDILEQRKRQRNDVIKSLSSLSLKNMDPHLLGHLSRFSTVGDMNNLRTATNNWTYKDPNTGNKIPISVRNPHPIDIRRSEDPYRKNSSFIIKDCKSVDEFLGRNNIAEILFEDDFNQPLFINDSGVITSVFPSSVKKITFGERFNQPIVKNDDEQYIQLLPPQLEYLDLGYDWDHATDHVKFPKTLTTLKLSNSFGYFNDLRCKFPPLINLSVEGYFNNAIPEEVYNSLETLECNTTSSYLHNSLKKLTKLHTIKFGNNMKNIMLFLRYEWPRSLKNIYVNEKIYRETVSYMKEYRPSLKIKVFKTNYTKSEDDDMDESEEDDMGEKYKNDMDESEEDDMDEKYKNDMDESEDD